MNLSNLLSNSLEKIIYLKGETERETKRKKEGVMRERERMIKVSGRKYKQPVNVSRGIPFTFLIAVSLKLYQSKRLHKRISSLASCVSQYKTQRSYKVSTSSCVLSLPL